MTGKTLRRKLQKKLKHKPYRRCPKCGNRMYVKFVAIDDGPWELPQTDDEDVLIKRCCGCKHEEQLFWTGGGTGRHIPLR